MSVLVDVDGGAGVALVDLMLVQQLAVTSSTWAVVASDVVGSHGREVAVHLCGASWMGEEQERGRCARWCALVRPDAPGARGQPGPGASTW